MQVDYSSQSERNRKKKEYLCQKTLKFSPLFWKNNLSLIINFAFLTPTTNMRIIRSPWDWKNSVLAPWQSCKRISNESRSHNTQPPVFIFGTSAGRVLGWAVCAMPVDLSCHIIILYDNPRRATGKNGNIDRAFWRSWCAFSRSFEPNGLAAIGGIRRLSRHFAPMPGKYAGTTAILPICRHFAQHAWAWLA